MVKAKGVLRVGIVGCGYIARLHISPILEAQGAELVAVCDVNEDLARQTARRFKIGACYSDFSELLSKEQPDLVHITTPPQTHLALCSQAMKAGCHVVVEKPMALNLADADSMIGVARGSGTRICVVHSALFVPSVIKARSMIEKGAVGDVIGIGITHTLPRDDGKMVSKEHWCHQLPGGIFGEMLPHPIYLASGFLGKLEPALVYSRKLSSHEWIVADELRVTLEGESGVATITSSVNGPGDIIDMDVLGTKASLHVGVLTGVVTRYVGADIRRIGRGLENIWSGYQWVSSTASAALAAASGRYHSGHHTLIQRFLKSVQEGTEPPVTVEEAREVVRLYEAITSQIQVRAGPASAAS